jgi:acyl carrier protein
MNAIEQRLKEILLEDLFAERKPEQILATDSLRGDFGIDSLGFVELKAQVDSAFGITICDEEFTPENFATIASLAQLIERYVQPA